MITCSFELFDRRYLRQFDLQKTNLQRSRRFRKCETNLWDFDNQSYCTVLEKILRRSSGYKDCVMVSFYR